MTGCPLTNGHLSVTTHKSVLTLIDIVIHFKIKSSPNPVKRTGSRGTTLIDCMMQSTLYTTCLGMPKIHITLVKRQYI